MLRLLIKQYFQAISFHTLENLIMVVSWGQTDYEVMSRSKSHALEGIQYIKQNQINEEMLKQKRSNKDRNHPNVDFARGTIGNVTFSNVCHFSNRKVADQ
jgi:hypothetical protein